MGLSNVLALLGGVALFLFGMTLMGEGLKKVAGNSLELILFRLSSTPLRGLLLGTGVTAVIQSSSATSVMVVGFVNSGMMKFEQAISVILGALIGTSVTGWIICLSSIDSSGWASLLSTATIFNVIAVIGIILRMFSKKTVRRHTGDILMGFAVLMFGMQAMSSAVAPLRESEAFINVLTSFSNPFLGILVGAAITSVLQSASAAVGILQALSMTGAVNFATAYPIILGIAIGAAVPVLLSALGAKVNGRRTAFAYLTIEVLGVLLCAALFYGFDAVFDFEIKSSVMNPVSIAALNSVFRLITAAVMLPFIKQLAALIRFFVKASDEEISADKEFDRLDERFLEHPALAVEQSRLTANSMAKTARDNLIHSLRLIGNYKPEEFEKGERVEDLIDRFEDRLGNYLVKVNGHELTPEQNRRVSDYLHTISDFERIGDHAMNVAESAREMYDKKIHFSPQAQKEFTVLARAVEEILQLSIASFIDEDMETAYKVEPLEECIDVLCDQMKLRHVERLQKGICSLEQGFIFNDLLTNLERVSDHCSNIAIALIELQTKSCEAHDYVINLKELHSHNFDELYTEYTEKYQI
ncbi:MAG: Na/Pi cotransporter family protein [Candidatus Limivicinus sp.]|jgi:phosphate:Na+ symporter